MKQILINMINIFKRLLGIDSVKTEKVLPKCETKDIINKYQRVANSENRAYRQTETKKEEYRRNTEDINIFPIVDDNNYSNHIPLDHFDNSSNSHSGFDNGFGGGDFGGGGSSSSWSDNSSSSYDSGSSYDSSSSCDSSSSSSD